MPCGCQKSERSREGYGPCEVCGWARGDWTPRKVRYCEFCEAWVCDRCWNDWPARIRAAILKRKAMWTEGRGADP